MPHRATASKPHSATAMASKGCAPDQERRLIERDEAQALWHAVGELPPKLRAVVHLFYVEGLSCEETARALGVTVSTVTTRLARARKQLERSLKGRLS